MPSSSSSGSFPHHYRVYGLRVGATDPLPGLPSASGHPPFAALDIVLHWGRLPPESVSGARTWHRTYTSDETDEKGRPIFVLDRSESAHPVLRLVYADDTRFWLTDQASEVWAWWPEALTPEDASTYLLGPVLGYVLRLRGLHVLHASAVSLAPSGGDASNNRLPGALAMVGPPGAGKSTMAAAFARRGHGVLTEDVCALCEGGSGCRDGFGQGDVARREVDTAPGEVDVLPGYPLIRLWPDSVEMLCGSPEVLPLLTPTWDKRYLALGGEGPEFLHESLPLRAIVLLAPREGSGAPRVEPVPPAEALIHLVGNTYKNLLLDRDQRVSEFRFLHRLLARIPVWRAVPHTDPAHLDALVDLLLHLPPGSLPGGAEEK